MTDISRKLALNKLNNTRDLGGIRTVDGRRIRCGRLFRSGQLYFADEEDRRTLAQLHLRRIYDFRSGEERIEKPDPVIEGAENLHLPVVRDLAAGITRDENSDRKAVDEIIGRSLSDPAYAVRYMSEMYDDLVQDSRSNFYYSRFLEDAARTLCSVPGSAVLWHCTAGKDRAGFAAVLMLEALGVDRAAIMEDYLSTNAYLAGEVGRLLTEIGTAQKLDSSGETAIRCLFGAREEYLDAAYRRVQIRWGSMDRFLQQGLGLTDSARQQLREHLLEN